MHRPRGRTGQEREGRPHVGAAHHARKRMPVQDVMAAGGWFEPDALQDAYQSSDPEGMLDVVNG